MNIIIGSTIMSIITYFIAKYMERKLYPDTTGVHPIISGILWPITLPILAEIWLHYITDEDRRP